MGLGKIKAVPECLIILKGKNNTSGKQDILYKRKL